MLSRYLLGLHHILLLLFVFLISCSPAPDSSNNLEMISKIFEVPPGTKNELPCRSIGGNCISASVCPSDRLSIERGLCPKQEHQGVVCCDLRSITKEECTRSGGKCVSRYEDCDEKISFFEGADCSINEKCC